MSFKCELCYELKEESEIIILSCNHTFCWSCINDHLKKEIKIKNKCPVLLCQVYIKDKYIRKILNDDDIKKYDDMCLRNIPNIHKCILPDCGFSSTFDNINIQFDCPSCSVFNCVKCKVAHKGMPCGALLSRNGESIDLISKRELERANNILQQKMAQSFRNSIVMSEKVIVVPNQSIFTCQLCFMVIGKKSGVILRGCFHEICRNCLKEHIKSHPSIPIACPFTPCKSFVEDRECREILTGDDNEVYENKCLTRASKNLEKADHCRQYNCNYLCDLEKNVQNWICRKCKSVNCVNCNAIHLNQTCKQYQNERVTSKDQENIEKLIEEKKLMRCLDCQTLIKKTRGCNWISCPNCGVELCWINQTHRWGPKGPGDISSGCKCMVNNKFCHPDCRGCIPDKSRRHARYAGLKSNDSNFIDHRHFLMSLINRAGRTENVSLDLSLPGQGLGMTPENEHRFLLPRRRSERSASNSIPNTPRNL